MSKFYVVQKEIYNAERIAPLSAREISDAVKKLVPDGYDMPIINIQGTYSNDTKAVEYSAKLWRVPAVVLLSRPDGAIIDMSLFTGLSNNKYELNKAQTLHI